MSPSCPPICSYFVSLSFRPHPLFHYTSSYSSLPLVYPLTHTLSYLPLDSQQLNFSLLSFTALAMLLHLPLLAFSTRSLLSSVFSCHFLSPTLFCYTCPLPLFRLFLIIPVLLSCLVVASVLSSHVEISFRLLLSILYSPPAAIFVLFFLSSLQPLVFMTFHTFLLLSFILLSFFSSLNVSSMPFFNPSSISILSSLPSASFLLYLLIPPPPPSPCDPLFVSTCSSPGSYTFPSPWSLFLSPVWASSSSPPLLNKPNHLFSNKSALSYLHCGSETKLERERDLRRSACVCVLISSPLLFSFKWRHSPHRDLALLQLTLTSYRALSSYPLLLFNLPLFFSTFFLILSLSNKRGDVTGPEALSFLLSLFFHSFSRFLSSVFPLSQQKASAALLRKTLPSLSSPSSMAAPFLFTLSVSSVLFHLPLPLSLSLTPPPCVFPLS